MENSCNYAGSYIDLLDREDNTVRRTYYETASKVGYEASRCYCFGDCDDTYEVVKVVMDGREVCYAGWMPGMRYEFYDIETHEIMFQDWFPNWEH